VESVLVQCDQLLVHQVRDTFVLVSFPWPLSPLIENTPSFEVQRRTGLNNGVPQDCYIFQLPVTSRIHSSMDDKRDKIFVPFATFFQIYFFTYPESVVDIIAHRSAVTGVAKFSQFQISTF
jgi:hypothetical protein